MIQNWKPKVRNLISPHLNLVPWKVFRPAALTIKSLRQALKTAHFVRQFFFFVSSTPKSDRGRILWKGTNQLETSSGEYIHENEIPVAILWHYRPGFYYPCQESKTPNPFRTVILIKFNSLSYRVPAERRVFQEIEFPRCCNRLFAYKM